MKKKHKWIKYSTAIPVTAGMLLLASAAVTGMVVSNKIVASTKAETNEVVAYSYKPIKVESSSWDASSIITRQRDSGKGDQPGDYRSIDMIDAPTATTIGYEMDRTDIFGKSALFLDSAAPNPTAEHVYGLSEPVDGYARITSENDYDETSTGITKPTAGNLYWNIPVSKTEAVKNSLKLYYGKSTKETTLKKNVYFEEDQLGAYSKIYALCIVSNCQSDGQQNITFTVNYTDKTTSTSTYPLYDWFKSDTNTRYKANDNYSRFYFDREGGISSGALTTAWDSGYKENEVILNQCQISLDTTKTVKSITCNLNATTPEKWQKSPVCTILGFSGETANILKPVNLKTIKTGKNKGDITWTLDGTSTENPTYYYLDIYHKDSSGNVEFDVENQKYEASKLAKTNTITLDEISGFTPAKDVMYYAVIRAANAKEEPTENSNSDWIYFDDADAPTKCECYVLDGTEKKYNFTIGINKPETVYTLVTDKDSIALADQTIDWVIPDSYKNKITYKKKTTNSNSGEVAWEVTSSVPITSTTLTVKSHADVSKTASVTPTITLEKPTLSYTDLKAKSVTLNWDKATITDGDITDKKYTLEISENEDFSGTEGTDKFTAEISDLNTTSLKTKTDKSWELTPVTKYYARIKTSCTYNSTSFASEWSDTINFTTPENAGKSLSLSDSTISLMLDDDMDTKTITSTIAGAEGGNATKQNVSWVETPQCVSIDVGEIKEYTSVSHKFTPVKAGAETLTLSNGAATSPLTAQVSVAVGVGTTSFTSNSTTPENITVNWKDVSWADSYVLKLYEGTSAETGTLVDTQAPAKGTTTYTYNNLKHNTSYTYTIEVINNAVHSDVVSKTVKTNESKPTAVEVYEGATKIEDMSQLDLLVGTEKIFTTKVVGQTYDKVYAADDQKVNKNVASSGTDISITDSSDGLTHTLKISNNEKGLTAFGLKANSKGPDDTYPEATIKVQPVSMQVSGPKDINENGFTIEWTDLSTYASDKNNLKYVFDVSTSQNFEAGTFVSGYQNKTINATDPEPTKLVVTGLKSGTTYWIRGKYVYNSVSSQYFSAAEVTTNEKLTEFSLNKSEINIIGGDTDNTLISTTVCPLKDLDVEYELSDESICKVKVEPIAGNDTYTIKHSFVITGLKTGTTTLIVRPKDVPGFQDQCVIHVVKGILDPVVAWADNVQTHSFELHWDSITDWLGKDVKYKVNVWWEEPYKKNYILRDYITNDTTVLLDASKGLITNQKYYCTVEAYNKHFETNTYNIVEVELVHTNPFPWWIVGTSIGSAIGGWLLISYILYIFWKKSWLLTYDQDKVKDKVKGKKVKTHDKYFRVIDKACVKTNSKIAKREDSLMTRLGTKNEQDEKYGKK